ncbi:hypothetical protein CH300_03620 [Rhodococcus sp. 15-1154-1]|nr:hypothetical protein [Rhodococcus sp. 15-1154-1]OZF08442.1 hypothetical protein CH300_03620 [Rhodococcus sp. 15-1154-1]
MSTSIVPPDAPQGGTVPTSPADGGTAALEAAIAAHADADSLSSVYAVARELHRPAAEVVLLATKSGHKIHDGHIVPAGLAVQQQLLATLALAGTPLTVDELVSRLEPRKAESSVRNALISDNRFVKADRSSWALAHWGLTPYVPIHRQIATIIAERGQIDIDELVAEITKTYDVKEHSIRTYASTGDFETHGNIVTTRTRKYVPRKSPSKTKHLYRDGSKIRWRTTIGSVHRKGSAFNLPSALAALIGVGPGRPREFSSRLGPQSVIWVSVQARSGTIKRFVEDMSLTDGDDVFLEFDDGHFDVTRVGPVSSNYSASIYAMVGRRAPTRASDSAALTAVGDSLWLDTPSSTEEIVGVLRQRRETELLDLVEPLTAKKST